MALYSRLSVAVGLSITWALLSFKPFPADSLPGFGFTPWYMNITGASSAAHSYARNLGGPRGITIPEVQREPLYPVVLVSLRLINIPEVRVVVLQWLCATAAIAFCFSHCLRAYGLATTLLFFLLICCSPLPPYYMSVMYPYAFQFSLVICGFLVLSSALASQKTLHFMVAGALLGCAAYERGSYLMLAAFGAPLLLLYMLRGVGASGDMPQHQTQPDEPGGRRDGSSQGRTRPGYLARLAADSRPSFTRTKNLVAFLLLAYLVPLPWLIRNARLGVVGMNHMGGYALGYAYGALPGGPRNDYTARYEEMVAARGSDSGTMTFIVDEVLAGRGTWQSNESRVARLAMAKMRANPAAVRTTIWNNIKRFPSRLLQADTLPARLRHRRISVWDYFHRYGSPVQRTAISDYGIFALALIGITIGLASRQALAGVTLWLLIYTFLFSTLITLFSPRYRGPLDAFLLLHAAYALAFPLALLARRRS